VSTIGSLIAPPDQAALARAILLDVSQSFQLNPQWD
jgi:hypothetical protein